MSVSTILNRSSMSEEVIMDWYWSRSSWSRALNAVSKEWWEVVDLSPGDRRGEELLLGSTCRVFRRDSWVTL